jgi:hypothetical protein
MSRAILFSVVLALSTAQTCQAEATAPTAPPAGAGRRAGYTFVGAFLGGLAGLMLAEGPLHEEVDSLGGATVDDIAYSSVGILIGAFTGYIVGSVAAAPPPARAVAWSDIHGAPNLASGAREGRIVVPFLRLSF